MEQNVEIKVAGTKALDLGFGTAGVLNPAGNNAPANFVRGFTYYFAAEQRNKRAIEIAAYVDAWKASKL